MNIQSEKQSLIEWISNLEDESIIEDIKMLKENSANGKDWWDEISEEERKGIIEGLKDLEDGNEIPYEVVREKFNKWLTK